LTNGLDAVIGLGGPGAGVGGPNTNEVVSNVAATFFPGVPDAAGARAVEVTPGGDLSGVDWPLPPPIPGRRVRGKLVDSRTGRPPANAYVMITPVNPDSGPSVLEAYGLGIGLSYNPSTGIVDFKSVLPGVYTIGAVMEEPLDRSEGPPLQTGPTMSFNVNPNVRIVSGSTSVTVAEKDVDDVVVVVAPTGALSGRLRVEGSFPAGPRGAQRFGVNLNPIRRNDVVNYYGGYSNASATADETFKLTVSAGEYRLTVQLPTNGYIKSAQLDGADVLESPLVLTGTPSGSLDIVVSSNSGQIQGSLVDERSEPVPRMQVVLVPNRSRGRFDLYKTTITDAAGSFTINGVTPGDYKVFSWESIERFSWFDPQVLERWEDRGAPVHVSESSVENVQVRLIPPGGAQ
jgi:hypothetical protein